MMFCTQSGAGLMGVLALQACAAFCGELLGFPVFLQWKEKPLPVYIVHCQIKCIGKGSLATWPLDRCICSQTDLLPAKQCA